MREQNQLFRNVRLTRANRQVVAAHVAKQAALGQVFVLDVEGVVEGFTVVGVNLPRVDTYFASAAITDLYVSPAYRGQGHGRTLLETAIGLIRDKGLHAATITVLAANEPARALYRKLGFLPQTESLILPLEPGRVKWQEQAP